MDNDEIRAMEAGPELDALVGEWVFGQTKWCPFDPYDELCKCDLTPPGTVHIRTPLPEFSGDIMWAWAVVDHMRSHEFSFHAKGWIKTPDVEVRFSDWYALNGVDGKVVYAIASTAPLAICRAALLALNEEEG